MNARPRSEYRLGATRDTLNTQTQTQTQVKHTSITHHPHIDVTFDGSNDSDTHITDTAFKATIHWHWEQLQYTHTKSPKIPRKSDKITQNRKRKQWRKRGCSPPILTEPSSGFGSVVGAAAWTIGKPATPTTSRTHNLTLNRPVGAIIRHQRPAAQRPKPTAVFGAPAFLCWGRMFPYQSALGVNLCPTPQQVCAVILSGFGANFQCFC